MIIVMVPPVIHFPLIAAAILYAAQFTIDAGMAEEVTIESQESNEYDYLKVLGIQRDKIVIEEAERVRKLLSLSDGFLVGEDTPVWIACRFRDSKAVTYTKLKQGIVKEAVDFWTSGGFVSLFTARSRRSVDDHINLARNLWHSTVETFETSPTYDTQEFVEKMDIKNVTKRSAPHSKVLYPSILVTMDYEITWPSDEMSQQKLIYERILYAVAFWNGVDYQLRHLQNPEVRLRVAGIVIGGNRAAMPYLRESSGWLGLSVEPSLRKMLKYWRNLAEVNKDFSPSGYNAVAVMSDSNLSPGFIYTVAGIATSGPPCTSSGTFIAGLVFSDDNAFGGIQTAVHEMGHLLGESGHDGDTDDCPEVTGYVHAQTVNNYGRTWSKCSLKHISTRLSQSGWWCMDEPKEYHPPGKPVEIILPGKLMPASQLCQARGWKDGIVCWDYVTCDRLYCSNNNSLSACNDAGATPDGTTCAPGKICLDGQCISNDVLASFWRSSF